MVFFFYPRLSVLRKLVLFSPLLYIILFPLSLLIYSAFVQAGRSHPLTTHRVWPFFFLPIRSPHLL